ncbi:AB hydrolase superfamily protein [Pleurotus pulmonarius]
MLKKSISLLAAFSFHLAAAQRQGPVVDLGYARYKGSIDDVANVTSFLGIRYAAAPIQDLRWRAPQPPPSSPGVQSATTPPPQCPQAFPNVTSPNAFPLPGNLTDTEDCLFLNVFVPRDRPINKKLPVIAWIHGGGYSLGNASSYDGTTLIRESNDGVVVVSIQYRLGIFGFLSSTKHCVPGFPSLSSDTFV